MSKSHGPQVEAGPEVPEVDTEQLGFKVLKQGKQGPKKVKILPRPWPVDALPPASANLLSVASKPGLLAAAGPNILVIASTDAVRTAFQNKTTADEIETADDPRLDERDIDVVADFTPDVTISTPNLRHVAFSANGDFLAVAAEERPTLHIYDVAAVVGAGKKDASMDLETDSTVRALLPNPVSETEQYFATVTDSGKLITFDVTTGNRMTLREFGVTCAAWSARGKALVSGSSDGSCDIHMAGGDLKGTIPRAPDVDESYEVSGLTWLKTEEFVVVYSLRKQEDEEHPEPKKISVITSTKGWGSFTYNAFPWDPFFEAAEAPPRPLPARMSFTRLRNWKPDLNDMLIITTSHADTIGILASTSNKISPNQEVCNEPMWITIDDAKAAAVPRTVYGEDMDSVLIGEALDLSSKEKILRPIAALEEINEAPWPLPAYITLTHEGLLAAWWVMWDKSIEAGERYPDLIFNSEATKLGASTSAATPSKLPVATTPFARPANGTPHTPAGSISLGRSSNTPGTSSIPQFSHNHNHTHNHAASGSPTPALMRPTPPGFGTPGFGTPGSSLPTPTMSKPPQPAFGAASSTGGASSFSSFGSNGSAAAAGSGFGALGQGQQRSGFSGLSTEPSFGSTVTVASGNGSSLPSWANTPSQQGSSLFGQQSKSSFNTASFESKTSETSEADAARKRDEATPTPQAPASQGMFGLAGGFKLGTTFASDGTAKDDPAKPAASANGSFFGSDFSNMLGKTGMKPPATPASEIPPEYVSTTPASPPKSKTLFSSQTPAKGSATPKAAPPVQEPNDAPLPPDFTKMKPSKPEDGPLPLDPIDTKLAQSADDDLPPLAGSPGIEVEAPSSSIEASPIENRDEEEDEEEFSEDDEEDEEDDEEEVDETYPPNRAPKSQPTKNGFPFNESITQSPSLFPPAPTPPIIKSGATSQSGRSASPSLFGQPSKSAGQQSFTGSSLFGQQSNKSIFSAKPDQSATSVRPSFQPPTNRAPSGRSISPMRSSSASRIQREPLVAPGAPLSSSIQGSGPPTPQLEDEEDERLRAQLALPIEPTRDLEEFVAYQNYTGGKSPSKTGHAAQIEMIYKDINGMVDALGWNARSLKSFTQYHEQPRPGHKIDQNVLERAQHEGHHGSWFDEFTLCEIKALRSLEGELEQELDAGRLQGVLDKLTQISRLLRDKAKLLTRLNDVRREIINRKDPAKAEALRKAPLPKELADGQKALRNDYAQLLTSLRKAEDAVAVLRSRLATHNAQNGNTKTVPSMEAVKRTVLRIAELAERKNNDILVVEAQMRKVGLADSSRPSSRASSSRNAGTPRPSRGTSLRNSIADNTPYLTPPTNRTRMTLSEINRRALTPDVEATPTPSKGYGFFYTPEGSPSLGKGMEIARLSDLVDERMDSLRDTAKSRKQVANGLKAALLKRVNTHLSCKMSYPVAEVAYLPLKPSLDLSSGKIKEAWQSTLRTIASQPGFKTGYWGRQIENPDTLQLVIGKWDSLSAHQAFMSNSAYKPFLQTLNEKILDGTPTLLHIKFPADSSASTPLLAPITECINTFFSPDYDQSQYTSRFAQFGAKAAAVPNLQATGAAGGWVVETLPHESLSEGTEGTVFNVFIGWPSVKVHEEFRASDHFGEVVPLLREGPKGAKMWHVAFEKFE
ncbi:nuclear pore complex subunit [Pyrenophora seminiperda CCB06]|uniref:Nuclear pore complex subunit n=1 Tax=Pyrenophora seminiperda CCB06 TaxID=1302712 RepID=A0A3M7M6N3_9PLEO|nr:nuclear pore complex subunit [Pyrenophora seminiperda CCB06]